MCSAGYLRSYKTVISSEIIGIHLLQCIPSDIVITVSGRSDKAAFVYIVFLECTKYFKLTELSIFVNSRKAVFKSIEHLFCRLQYIFANTEILIYGSEIIYLHQNKPLFLHSSVMNSIMAFISPANSRLSIIIISGSLLYHVSCLLAKCLVLSFI